MKTETQIAKGHILIWKGTKKESEIAHESVKYSLRQHKATCQRFLEFLEEEMKRGETINELSEAYISTGELEEKITDLKQAIKLYEDAGI